MSDRAGVDNELCVTVAEQRLKLTMETIEGAIYAVESGRARESYSDDVESEKKRTIHPNLARDLTETAC